VQSFRPQLRLPAGSLRCGLLRHEPPGRALAAVGGSDYVAAMTSNRQTTNYLDTFITVAPDCAAVAGLEPPARTTPSVAERTYVMMSERPYELTSDDVLFAVWADRSGIAESERPVAREAFFSKGQPCLRASDLAKKYGWGIHSDGEGRVALFAVGSPGYRQLAQGRAVTGGGTVKVITAMRSSRR